MGYVVDTEDDNFGLERRRESFYINDYGKPQEIFLYPTTGEPEGGVRSGTVEISKKMLKKIIKYFNEHPEDLDS